MFYINYNMLILNLICPGIRVSVPLFRSYSNLHRQLIKYVIIINIIA